MRFLRATPLLDENDPRFVTGTPEQQKQARAIAIGPKLSEELFDHRARSSYAGDDELVFCHPDKGTVLDHKRYAKTLRDGPGEGKHHAQVRPFHDYRHTAITHEALLLGTRRRRSRPVLDTPTSRRRSGTSTSPASSSATRRNGPNSASSARFGYRIWVPSESMACRYLLRNPPISSD